MTTPISSGREGNTLYIYVFVDIRDWNLFIGIGRKKLFSAKTLSSLLLGNLRSLLYFNFNTVWQTFGVWKAKHICHLIFLLEEAECVRTWSPKNEEFLLLRHSHNSWSQMQLAKLYACRNTRKSTLRPPKYLSMLAVFCITF